MTKQDFIALYGKSVYQVRLEIGIALFCASDSDAQTCLAYATDFISELLQEDPQEIPFMID